MRKLAFLLAVFTFTSQASAPTAAEVKVTWLNPEKYTDIRPATGSKASYQKQVIKEFDKIWADFAKKLPAGYRLEVTIKDLDLAGDVNPMYQIDHNDIRVVKDIYFPRMNLDYVLFNENKQEIAAIKDEKIKDMGFMMSSPKGYGHRQFAYEAAMLDKWFSRNIAPKLPVTTVAK